MKKRNEKKGIVFWVTGLPGSGKTSVVLAYYEKLKLEGKIVKLYSLHMGSPMGQLHAVLLLVG